MEFAVLIVVAVLKVREINKRQTIYRGRNFFGLVSVEHRSRNDPRWDGYALRSGHIMHGRVRIDCAVPSDSISYPAM